jgi:hypothetical protein
VTTTPPAGERIAGDGGSDDADTARVEPVRRAAPANEGDGRPTGPSSRGRTPGSGRARPDQPSTSRSRAEAPRAPADSEPDDSRSPARSRLRPAAPQSTDDVDAPDGGRRTLGYRRQRFEARKVRRLIRHVDPWSMLKLSLLVSLCMWLILVIASVVLWTVARNAGTVESIESFVNSSLSLQDWSLEGDVLFRQFALITLLLSLAFTAATVVASLVFNLVSDIIGGVWVSVIEEETARPVSESKPRSDVR